ALRTVCGSHDPQLVSYEQIEKSPSSIEAELVIVCLPVINPDRGLQVIKRLRDSTTGHFFAVGHILDPKLILKAMQAGADLYIDQTDLEGELQASLVRVRAKQEANAQAA